jgi:predicted peroxiredoxin
MSEQALHKLAILLWATGPARPELCATPFFHAAAAAALDAEVEVYFAARSVLLLVPGCAEGLRASERDETTIADHMRHALDHGAKFFACASALAAHGLDYAELIPAVAGRAGATAFIGRCLDPRWASLTF